MMGNQPLISIIIPVFNREDIIKSTLHSIINQTYANWECLVIDDGSNDATETTLACFTKINRQIQFLKRPKKLQKGANSCRNYGFSIAKGDYVNWFDSDDIMMPTFLEDKLNAFNNKLDAVVHKNQYANYSLTNFRESKYVQNNGHSLFYNYAIENIEIQTCGFLWRKSYLDNKKLFNVNISRYQDNEFHIRMIALQPNIKFLAKTLATIRSGNGHESQISAVNNITKEKLFDIFYYRYLCLKLAKENILNTDAYFHKIIAKKAIWTFYSALKKEEKAFTRYKDFMANKTYIQFILNCKEFKFLDKVKTTVNIIKIIFLG